MLHFLNVWGQNIAQTVIHSLFPQRLRSNYWKNVIHSLFSQHLSSKYCKTNDTFVPRTPQSTPPCQASKTFRIHRFVNQTWYTKRALSKSGNFIGGRISGLSGLVFLFPIRPQMCVFSNTSTRISTRRSSFRAEPRRVNNFSGSQYIQPRLTEIFLIELFLIRLRGYLRKCPKHVK